MMNTQQKVMVKDVPTSRNFAFTNVLVIVSTKAHRASTDFSIT